MVVVMMPLVTMARLGETEGECSARYGESSKAVEALPLLGGATTLQYKYQGWMIRAAFVDGVAVRILYHKLLAPNVAPKIFDDEAKVILQGEAGGGQWREVSPGLFLVASGMKNWQNSNGRTAKLFVNQMTVDSPEAQAFIQARKAQKEAQRKASIPHF